MFEAEPSLSEPKASKKGREIASEVASRRRGRSKIESLFKQTPEVVRLKPNGLT
jgi:hypothetical protein